MQNIETWMKDFSQAWKDYDIQKVISLFTQDVEYWENPYEKFENIEELTHAWEYIHTQKEIHFEYSLFLGEAKSYVIEWDLEYFGEDNKKNIWSGVYLIKLNSDNLCYYFKQIGEQGS